MAITIVRSVKLMIGMIEISNRIRSVIYHEDDEEEIIFREWIIYRLIIIRFVNNFRSTRKWNR